jgi:hypothetical protein
MPKSQSEKCRLCAKLSATEAIAKHGPSGTGCWDGDKCHKRRTYYRNRDRYNQSKRQQYRHLAETPSIAVPAQEKILTLSPPVAAAAVLLLYRARVDDPLHAIGAELWLGQNKIAMIEPVHTLGLAPAQVKAFLKEILAAFSQQVGGNDVTQFEMQKELSPDCCPIRPCPLWD